jgi:hypothetical protein
VRLALALVSALVLATPAAAEAATITAANFAGGTYNASASGITYSAAPGEANNVTAERVEGGIRVRDSGATIHPSGDCRRDGADAICQVTSIQVNAQIDLGDGSDAIDWRVSYADVRGGPGDDQLVAPSGRVTGGTGADLLQAISVSYEDRSDDLQISLDDVANDGAPGEGDDVKGADYVTAGSGNDLLVAGVDAYGAGDSLAGGGGDDRLVGSGGEDHLGGGAGDDRLEAGGGADQLDGGDGADRIRGGDGRDRVSYAQRRVGVTVTLDSGAEDGEPGEGDDVGEVEDVYGSTAPDVLVGTDGPNRIEGGLFGPDTILGLGGDDVIETTTGDRIVGGPGSDRISAGSVARLELRDGEEDHAACGLEGAASLDADPFDKLPGCSFARLRFAGHPSSPLPLRTARDGRVYVRAECLASMDRRCDGALRMLELPSRKLLATGPFHLGRGQTGRVRLKLRPAGRTRQRKRPSVAVELAAAHQVPSEGPAVPGVDRVETLWLTRRRR